MKLKAFHGSQELKDRLIAEMKAHAEADELIKGQYWEGGKGCAVGCMTKLSGEDKPHEQYPEMFGLPEWLAHLEDRLFEGTTNEYAKKIPIRLLEAIPVGADLTGVDDEFKLWLLKNELHFDRGAYPEVEAAINTVIGLYDRLLAGEAVPDNEWSSAESAARSAARFAARFAAESAAWSAAESAAWSAARSAAESAAWSAAWSAAESAAWSAAYERMAEKLLELLGGAV